MHDLPGRYAQIADKARARYARRLLDLQIEPDAISGDNAYPFQVTARLERLDPAHEGQIETIKALAM